MIFLFSQNKTKVYYNLKLTERFYKETTRIGFLLLALVSMRVNIVSTEFGWNSQLVFALSREDIRKIAEFNSELENYEKNKEKIAL